MNGMPDGATTVADALRTAGIDALEARVLLRAALGVGDDAPLAAHPERALSGAERERYRALLQRRREGEPVAYLTGEREFYSLALHVTPAVLIPRPETELLVAAALDRVAERIPCRVLDLATGSGCVAVAIAVQRPRAAVTASDASAEALAVARANAARHNVPVEFIQGDWFSALAGRRFDGIVCNPPYVAENDPYLSRGDLRYEPRRALVAGPTGLECIAVVVSQAAQHLAAKGWLLIEHGHDQGAGARALLEGAGYRDVVTYRDLAGIERVSGGRI